jgi:predicted secreted protein
MKNLSVLLVFIALFVGFTSVAQPKKGKKTVKKAMITLTEKDNGQSVTVKLNQPFQVLFKKECIGCRGIWTLTDNSAIKKVSEKWTNKSCTNCTGGNQDHTFVLKATKAGTTALEFTYMDEAYRVELNVK